ncbi:hypothetical protein DFJ77DRAFT_439880 [Powellomyces hirtus]|nr:hypothetical protein DFJ77DRAFT_439880 [Powellomyces hirtus]
MSHHKQYKHSRRGTARKRPHVEDKDLLGFGYACRLFRNDAQAAQIDSGKHLLPWQHGANDGSEPLLIDRYDVRNLLEDLSGFDNHAQEDDSDGITRADGTAVVVESDQEELNKERYLDVDSDEEAMYDLDEEEQRIFKEEKRRRDRVGPTEDQMDDTTAADDGSKEEPASPEVFDLKYPAPTGITPPTTSRLASIIEKTAKFVNASTNPQMEFLVKAKQAGNRDFAFMEVTSPLHAYYKHVRKVMTTALGGLGDYGSDASSDSDDNGSQADPGAEPAIGDTTAVDDHSMPDGIASGAIESIENVEGPPSGIPPAELQSVIDKLAMFVARNGQEFEAKVKAKNRGDPRFAFLLPWNEWHGYYMSVRDDYLNHPDNNTPQGVVENGQADADAVVSGNGLDANKSAKLARARAALEKIRAGKMKNAPAGGMTGTSEQPMAKHLSRPSSPSPPPREQKRRKWD